VSASVDNSAGPPGGLSRLLRALLKGRSGVATVVHTLSANVLILIVNLVTGIVTARYLGADGRGELAAIITLPTFLSFLMLLGLPSGLIFQVRRRPEDSASLVGAASAIVVAMGVLGAIVGVFLTPRVLAKYDASLVRFAQAMMFTTILGSISMLTLAALQTREYFAAYNRVRYLQPVIMLAALLGFGIVGWLNAYSGATITLLAGLPALLWSVFWMQREYKPTLQGFRLAAPRLLSYGLRAYGGELLVSAASQLDRVIVVGVFSPAAMGMYVIALNLSRSLAIFPSAVTSVLFPKTSGRGRHDVLRLTGQASTCTTLAVGMAAGGLATVGPWLLTLLYGPEFADASLAFRLLVVEAALSAVVTVLSQGFMSLNRPALVAWQHGAGVVLLVPLLYLLAPRYGAAGAAVALLCGTIARLLCTYGCYWFGLRVRVPIVMPSLALLKSICGSRLG
jgi:O-antigen/teichoic acid export membrane protein